MERTSNERKKQLRIQLEEINRHLDEGEKALRDRMSRYCRGEQLPEPPWSYSRKYEKYTDLRRKRREAIGEIDNPDGLKYVSEGNNVGNHKLHPPSSRRQYDWRRQGIAEFTVRDYTSLLRKQRKRCAICGKRQTASTPLVVDHSHRDGRVRGLLCHHCNLTIGKMEVEMSVSPMNTFVGEIDFGELSVLKFSSSIRDFLDRAEYEFVKKLVKLAEEEYVDELMGRLDLDIDVRKSEDPLIVALNNRKATDWYDDADRLLSDPLLGLIGVIELRENQTESPIFTGLKGRGVSRMRLEDYL